MKIALLGYGKMGKEIEKIALERGHEIVLKASVASYNATDLAHADAAIEFSVPEAATTNIRACFNANVPAVVGTTGWYHDYETIRQECLDQQQALLCATNFSVGVNLFFALNKKLAALMAPYPEYEVAVDEIHHTQKLDAPSGTAITIAEGIIDLTHKTRWINEPAVQPNDLSIISHRIEEVPGTHAITYSSAIDDIEIKHTAKNRKGFALGAVLAAEWISGRTGVFTMNDMLNI